MAHMHRAVRLRATRGLAACLRQRVWAFGSLAFCASPRSWYPFSALVSLPLRRHCACPLAFSLTQRPAISRSSSVRYSHTGLFPPRRHRSFLPLSPPHSNVPTVYPPSIRASAHSPSLSSCTSNRSRCANESRKVSKMFFHSTSIMI